MVDKYQDTDLCPRCEPIPRPPADGRSYAYLLGLYLGDGCITPAGDPAKGVWRLRIMCGDDWPGLIDERVLAMSSIRPAHKVSRVPSQGCTEVHGNWKHWPCVFPQHGPGKKHDRRILLEKWQQEIVDAEPQALDRLGVAWRTQVRKRSEPRHRETHVISISRREAVARMDSFVGPKY